MNRFLRDLTGAPRLTVPAPEDVAMGVVVLLALCVFTWFSLSRPGLKPQPPEPVRILLEHARPH